MHLGLLAVLVQRGYNVVVLLGDTLSISFRLNLRESYFLVARVGLHLLGEGILPSLDVGLLPFIVVLSLARLALVSCHLE